MNTNLQTTSNKLVLDFHQRTCKTVLAREYDKGSRFIPIQCTENGELFKLDSSIEIQVKVLTPDNRALLEHSATIQNDGSILLELTENMLYYPGKATVELIFYDFEHKKRLSPMKFDLLIDSSAYPDDRVLSSDEFNALTDLLEKATADYTYVIKEAESWAHGNTGIREDEDTDNSKYWCEQSKQYSDIWKGSLLPQGTIPFSQIPTTGNIAGHMYNINEAFVTDSRFKDGAGYSYPAGTNVYWTQDEKWDCLSGILTREITQSQYDNLSNAEKMNGTIYYISDADNSINNASQNSAGLMSQEDKKKLDGIASGATRVLVDSNLSSSSINPIQNKIITNALNAEIDRAKEQEALKAPITNPTFYGIPRVSTANEGTNSTQIASTAFTQTAVSNHNISSNAHNDIRELITGLTNRLNTLADSDDTTLDQLSEIVTYIKSNRSLIENVTTGKVNVGDIIDNLTSSAVNKPLAARQGKVLNDLITVLTSTVEGKVSKAGDTIDGTIIVNGSFIATGETTLQGAIYINGESAARYKKLTQAEYNALPSTKNSDNVIYFITD